MKKYYISLISLTLVLVIASFAALWLGYDKYQSILSILPLYFAVVTGVQHYAVVQSLYKDPRVFIKNFLGINLGSLFLHLIVLFIWAFTHIPTARPFILGFCICYASYLIFETVALVMLVRNNRRQANQQ